MHQYGKVSYKMKGSCASMVNHSCQDSYTEFGTFFVKFAISKKHASNSVRKAAVFANNQFLDFFLFKHKSYFLEFLLGLKMSK